MFIALYKFHVKEGREEIHSCLVNSKILYEMQVEEDYFQIKTFSE